VRTALTIASRELGSYFRTPAGWVIVALYLFLAGVVFTLSVFMPGRPASLRDFFAVSGWLLLPVAPAISMRLIAEELRSGTIEPLMTSPVGSASLVLGKFAGACVFMLAMLAPTAAYVVVLYRTAEPAPDPGPIAAGYLCLALVGSLSLSIGTLASALTSNATLAFMMTLFGLLGLLFVPSAAPFAPAAIRPALMALAVTPRIGDFAKGVVDTAHVAFFLGASAWFLLLAVAAVEIRRWR